MQGQEALGKYVENLPYKKGELVTFTFSGTAYIRNTTDFEKTIGGNLAGCPAMYLGCFIERVPCTLGDYADFLIKPAVRLLYGEKIIEAVFTVSPYELSQQPYFYLIPMKDWKKYFKQYAVQRLSQKMGGK